MASGVGLGISPSGPERKEVVALLLEGRGSYFSVRFTANRLIIQCLTRVIT